MSIVYHSERLLSGLNSSPFYPRLIQLFYASTPETKATGDLCVLERETAPGT